tara:strand:+ start:851 stop:1060 length:210 start_codon:yes stop_codon:yes gene_type:complete
MKFYVGDKLEMYGDVFDVKKVESGRIFIVNIRFFDRWISMIDLSQLKEMNKIKIIESYLGKLVKEYRKI